MSLYNTFWEDDSGNKINLIDLLNLTANLDAESVELEILKPYLLVCEEIDDIKRIEKANLEYPILILTNDKKEILFIIDGHHRAHKAIKNGLKEIKAKLIPLASLPEQFRTILHPTA